MSDGRHSYQDYSVADADQSRHVAWNDRDHRRSVRHSIVMRRAIASVVALIPLAAVLTACAEAVADEMPAAAAPVEPAYFTGSLPGIKMVGMWVRDAPPVTRNDVLIYNFKLCYRITAAVPSSHYYVQGKSEDRSWPTDGGGIIHSERDVPFTWLTSWIGAPDGRKWQFRVRAGDDRKDNTEPWQESDVVTLDVKAPPFRHHSDCRALNDLGRRR